MPEIVRVIPDTLGESRKFVRVAERIAIGVPAESHQLLLANLGVDIATIVRLMTENPEALDAGFLRRAAGEITIEGQSGSMTRPIAVPVKGHEEAARRGTAAVVQANNPDAIVNI